MSTLASNLQPLFGKKSWHTLWQTYTLVRNWPEIAGSKIAERTEPAYIQKDTLWVHVKNSVWMQHMQTMKPEIIEKVRQFIPELNIIDIRWIIQPAEPLAGVNRNDRTVAHQVDPAQQEAFEQISSIVENEECRTALCKLWRTYHKNREI